MRTSLPPWEEAVQHVKKERDCPSDLRQATRIPAKILMIPCTWPLLGKKTIDKSDAKVY